MDEDRQDRIEMIGTVIEALKASNFKVIVEGGLEINANLSGKMRQNKIRVIVGDSVTVEVSPYDLTRGRISRRH